MADTHTEVIVSDGEPLRVRRLGIFELDQFRSEIPGPFTYKMKTITGEEYDVIFDISKFKEPPEMPEFEEPPEEHSKKWYQLRTAQLYQAAESHEETSRRKRLQFYISIVRHILYTCIAEEDIQRIITETDWDKVHSAAIIPQLSREILANELRSTFRASYDDKEIFDALADVAGGHGVYDAIRLWENKVMLQLRMTEVEYALLPVNERARKVCALILDDMMSNLEMDRMKRERDKKRGNS